MLAMSEPPDFSQLFLEHLALIERTIRFISFRHRLQPADREDFGSCVKLHLIDNDYAVLRQCRDWSRPKSFFAVVIANQCKDFLIQLRGKKRPSAKAVQLGEVAVQLERLLRDGWSFPEACEILRTNFKVVKTDAEFTEIAIQLPDYLGRRPEGDEELERIAASDMPPDRPLIEEEEQHKSQEVFAVLTQELAKLPDEDRMVLRLHFEEGWSWKKVADNLWLDTDLYRRKDVILKGLKEAMKRAGITEEAMGETLKSVGLAYWNRRGK